jgi:hypothetical protein
MTQQNLKYVSMKNKIKNFEFTFKHITIQFHS